MHNVPASGSLCLLWMEIDIQQLLGNPRTHLVLYVYKLSEKRHEEVKALFNADSKVWVDGVELALKEFEDVKVYPQKFLLCGGGTLLSNIKTSLMEHPWLQVLRFERFPEVEFISPKNLKGIVDEQGLLKDVSDVAPAALAYMVLELK